MMADEVNIVELVEYVPLTLPRHELPEEVGEAAWRDYSPQVHVEFPSPATGWQWRLTSQGWVGHLPLPQGFALRLLPRVELGNLFRMLEYAYRLGSFSFLEGAYTADSIEDFYSRLAGELAQRVLARSHKGLYRTYVGRSDPLPFVAGRMDAAALARKPWQVAVECHFQEHTADVEENQIPAWTLNTILRGGLCREPALNAVRRAHRTLQGTVSLQQFKASDCYRRLYDRLNEDYRPLHSLCRFFLENTGPSHAHGGREMLPFRVNMARLYELFVAEWLREHVPVGWEFTAQEEFNVGESGALSFNIDLVLYDEATGAPLCVLDTKYKTAPQPKTDDIFQVIGYAEAKGCKEAVLLYPVHLSKPFDEKIGDIRVRSMTFALSGDLNSSGEFFMDKLCRNLSAPSEH
jgi:5-methylcytosine-specific restriction enzyme subunit McrC